MCHDSCHDLQECVSPTPEVSSRARCRRVWKASESVSTLVCYRIVPPGEPFGRGTSGPRGPGACAGLPPVGAPVRWRMPDHCLCQHDSPGDPSCLQQRLFCLVQRFRRRGRSPTGANGELPAHLAHPNLVSWGLWRRPSVPEHARPAPLSHRPLQPRVFMPRLPETSAPFSPLL